MLIVSLTTIPPRFSQLGGFIAGLEAQTVKPDRVELYLPPSYRRFPGPRPALPPLPGWIEVIDTGEDLGPATKILPATQRWRGQDVDLLYCDDDMPYDPSWIARMIAARRQHPSAALCERGLFVGDLTNFSPVTPEPRAVLNLAARIELGKAFNNPGYVPPPGDHQVFSSAGNVDIMEGLGGVLVRPDAFHEDAYQSPDVIWAVDDIWLSGMANLKGTQIWALESQMPGLKLSDAARSNPLFQHKELGLGRNQLNTLAIAWFRETYGIWV